MARETCLDGFGRLAQVFEPNSSNSLVNETDYQYDPLNNLICAVQRGTDTTGFTTCAAASATWRPRSFVFNSLSQLLSATNPESGTASYTYDLNGNVLTKIAPLPNQTGTATVTTTYATDALNRLTQKSYSDGATATVKYGYDAVAPTGCTLPTLTIHNGVGQRTGMCDAAGAEAWSFDITSGIGWKVTDARTTNSVTLTSIFQSNFDGSLATLTYPSGRILTFTPNAAGRTISAVDSTGPINYATNAIYAPQGSLASVQNGGSLYSTSLFNNALQPCWLYATTTASGAPANCAQTGVTNATILDYEYNFGLGVADNGNVNQIANRRDPTRTQNLTYDTLNRISNAQTQTSGVTIPNSNCWGLTFGYDIWGNLLQSTATGPSGCSEPLPSNFSASTSNQITSNNVANQITDYCYDSAGNLIFITAPSNSCPTVGPYQYTYNAENQLTATASIVYTYDGDGRRVEKSNGRLYWYGTGTDPLDETDLAGNTNNTSFYEYIFFAGKRIARRDYSNNVDFYFADHLGSARVVTNGAGTILDDSDFYPFGGERPVVGPTTGNTYKFTGKERDSESGLDNFDARYLGSSMGRFMSADPANAGASVNNPQSWNGYSYGLNNPLKYVDPNGLDCIYLNEEGNAVDHILHSDCESETDNGYWVDNDENHPVQKSDVSFSGDANTMLVSFTSQNDLFGLGHFQQFCIGSCPDNSVTVSVGLSDPLSTTMRAAPVGLLPANLKPYEPPALFDFWHMTNQQQTRVSTCWATGGEFGGETIEPPEAGQAVAQVRGANGEPAKYPGNGKPVIPNIKGAKRTPRVTGPAGGIEWIAGGMNCAQNVANQ